jgi:uncharacterized protein YdaT
VVETLALANHVQRALHVGWAPLRSKEIQDMSNKDQLFVEQREQGDYAVRRGGADRASAVCDTQKEAIERARELNPNQAPLVERVRDTKVGGRDQWRKP